MSQTSLPNQTTRRALLGAGLAVSLLGNTKVGGESSDDQDPSKGPTTKQTSTGKQTSKNDETTQAPQVPDAPEGLIAWTSVDRPTLAPAGTVAGEQLRTAHHDVTVIGHASLASVTLSQVSNLEPEQKAMRAPEGYELLAVQLRAGTPAWGHDTKAAIEISVGGKVTKVEAPFGAYNASLQAYTNPDRGVLLLAKKDEPVTLVFRDIERTAQIDLRSGKRLRDAQTSSFDGFLNKKGISATPSSAKWSRPFKTVDPRFVSESDTLTLNVEGDFSTMLMPWTPTLGWAPANQLWLQIKLTPQYLYSTKPQRALNPTGVLHISRSYILTPAGGSGSYGKTSVDKVNAQDYVTSYDKPITVSWPVPATMKTAKITANFPVNEMKVKYTNGTVAAQFTGNPTIATFNVVVS